MILSPEPKFRIQMNLQSLVVVILRLLAIDFLLRAAVQLTPLLLHFIQVTEPMSRYSTSYVVVPWLIIVGVIITAVVLWVLAMPIARFVTRGVSNDLTFGAMSLTDCYSIAFMGVGLFYIASHLPQVLNWMHFLLKVAASGTRNSGDDVLGYDVSKVVITFIVGVVLFLNGRRWAVALAGRQEIAKQEASNKQPTS